MEAEGVELVRARRDALYGLIRDDPEMALSLTVSTRSRADLPEAVRSLLEERVGGTGDLAVFGVTPGVVRTGSRDLVLRYVDFGGERYEAFTYGRRLNQRTGRGLSLHGIAVDGRMALHESPLRLMETGERFAAGSKVFEYLCETGAVVETNDAPAEVRGGTVAAESPGGVYLLCGERGCGPKHFMALTDDFISENEDDWIPHPYETRGDKSVLVIRLVLQQEGEDNGEEDPQFLSPPDGETVRTSMEAVNDFLRANSFRQFSFTTVHVTEALEPNGVIGMNPATVQEEARARANDAGYVGEYDFVIVATAAVEGLPAGYGLVGGKGAWVIGAFNPAVVVHELGHNFGLFHSRYWAPVGPLGGYPIENARTVEAGNVFDIMSTIQAFPANHFKASFKSFLRWLPEANTHVVPDATSSGTFRLHRLDGGAGHVPERRQAIRVVNRNHWEFPDPPLKDYWIEFRQLFEANERAREGVVISWGDEGSFFGNHLLNMRQAVHGVTVGLSSAADSPLAIGETFSDPFTNLHITPLGVGGSAPHEFIDVAVTRGILQVELTEPSGYFSIENPDGVVEIPLNHAVALSADAWATGSLVDVVEFLVNGEMIGEGEPVGGGGYRLDFTFEAFDPGIHELRARVRNEAGNERTSSVVLIEVVPPALQAGLQVSRDRIVLGETVELSVIDGEFFTVTEVEFLVEGESLGVVDAAPFVYEWSPAAPGDYFIQALVSFDSGETLPSDFVTVFVSDVLLDSPPAFSWRVRSSGTAADLFDVIFDGERFFAVGASGTLLSSGDAREWVPGDTGVTADLRGLAEGDGRYVAVGETGFVLESEDATEWIRVEPQTIRGFHSVAFGDGEFVAVGRDGRTKLRQSDGTWRLRFAGEFFDLHDVTYGAGRFVAVGAGGSVYSSEDGMDWTRRDSGTTNPLYGIAYGNERFVAVGGAAEPVALTSLDGINWRSQSVDSGGGLRGVRFGDELFVVVGTGGAIATTIYGDRWRANASGVPQTLEGVIFGETFWVAAGREGVIIESLASGYANWLSVHLSASDFANPEWIDPRGDRGGHGIPNLLRYALGIDPHSPDPEDLPRVGLIHDDATGGDYLAIEFTRRIGAADVALLVEVSEDLENWEVLGDQQIVELISTGGIETLTVMDNVPVTEQATRFMRIRVEMRE